MLQHASCECSPAGRDDGLYTGEKNRPHGIGYFKTLQGFPKPKVI